MDPRKRARWEAVGLGEDPPRRQVTFAPADLHARPSDGSISVAIAHDAAADDRSKQGGARLAGGPFWAMLVLSLTSIALTVGFELRHRSESAPPVIASPVVAPPVVASPVIASPVIASPVIASPPKVGVEAAPLPAPPTAVVAPAVQPSTPIVAPEAALPPVESAASPPHAAKPRVKRAPAKAANATARAPLPAKPLGESADNETKAVLDALSEARRATAD